jgi:hypothetical protein
MFFQIARETILLLINNIHEKIMQSRLRNKKLRKFKKNFKLRNLHCISFFDTVFQKNCTALIANQN